MKYRILAVLLMLLAAFSITASAASYEYSISLSDDFISAQSGDDLTDIAKKLNMTADDLNSYFNQNGLIYLAVSRDTKTQIRLSAFTDNFSSAVGDISQLDNQALTEFVNAVSEDRDNAADVITNAGRKYICTKSTLKDSGGTYTVTQYITICSNKTFYFAGYNEGNDTSAEIKSAFEGFRLNQKQIQAEDYTTQFVFIIIGVLIFSTISVIMILGIIKSKNKTGE